ncbi:MAG: hypothetical protein ACSHXD_08025 [Marinosulfonomonas sp.]
MTPQVEMITLPLPHGWFEADTALPKHRFRATNLATGAKAIEQVAARVSGVTPPEKSDDVENTLDSAQRLFDSYFNVERDDTAPVSLFRSALSQALPACARDIQTGVSLTDEELQTLALGLQRLADWAQFAPEPTETPKTTAPAQQENVLYRWKQQHQLFFLIIHGMLYLLHVLEEALDKEHAPVVRAILDDFAELMEGSAVAFRLAGDFSIDGYDTEIRPDMHRHDPHFSGLFYADHKELVTSLRVLKRVPDDFDEEMNRVGDAISAAYEAHALVCLRFVGDSSSLASKDPSRVAAESIRGKYVKRTKVIAGLAQPR